MYSKHLILAVLGVLILAIDLPAQSSKDTEGQLTRAHSSPSFETDVFVFQIFENGTTEQKAELESILIQKKGVISWNFNSDEQCISITAHSTFKRASILDLIKSVGLKPIEHQEELIYQKIREK